MAVPGHACSWPPGRTGPDGRIVGLLTLAVFRIPTGVRAWIEDVVVDESERGQGVGEALTREALRRAEAAGARTVDLTSRPSREAANRLYRRLGFVDRETNVYRYDVRVRDRPVRRRIEGVTMLRPSCRIYSVGYEGTTAEELADRLARHGVSLLVDVRLQPWSRRPGFSKQPLSVTLAMAGIEYVHEPLFGNPHENRDAYRQGDPAAVQVMQRAAGGAQGPAGARQARPGGPLPRRGRAVRRAGVEPLPPAGHHRHGQGQGPRARGRRPRPVRRPPGQPPDQARRSRRSPPRPPRRCRGRGRPGRGR